MPGNVAIHSGWTPAYRLSSSALSPVAPRAVAWRRLAWFVLLPSMPTLMPTRRLHLQRPLALRLKQRLRQLCLLLGIMVMVLPPCSRAWGQAGTAVSPAGEAAGAAAVPIPVQEILARADQEQQRVDRARRLLAEPDPVERLGRLLDDIARPVDTKLHLAAGTTLRSLPVMRLESLARHWDFDDRRFQAWEAQARHALAPFADSALQLGQNRAAWSATRAEGVLDSMPEALSGRVDTVIGQIDATEALLGTALERQFALTRRANELKARIQSGRGEVAAAIDEIDRRLLLNDAPPLWLGLGNTVGTQAASDAMHAGLEIERQFAIDYHAAGTGNQQALRVVQLLLLPLILWLLARSRQGETAASDQTTRVLRRPVSVWLLLSMLSVLGLEPDAPMLVQEAAMVLALVPVLRLLPAATARALGIWPYVAVALYVLDRLCAAVVADSGTYRLLLLALNLLALGLTLRMVRQPMPAPSMDGDVTLQRVARGLGWAVLAALVVAAVANVTGNVSLAEMLTNGVIDSGYMALLLYAGVTACLALLHALLRQPELANRRLISRQAPVLRTVCSRLLLLAAAGGWLVFSADHFRILRPLHDVGRSILGLGIEVGEVSIHLGDVLVFVFASWLAVWVARGVRRLLRKELPGHSNLPRGVGNSIASLSYYGVVLLGLLVALSAAGFKVSQLALVFSALGVGIGFGLQAVVNNFVSGLVLMVERPIQPGDVIDAAGSSGTVRDIGLRATTIRTFDGADVIVPNGLLLSGNLTNWTMHDQHRRIDITVRVAYTDTPARVLAVLNAAARETAGVASQPAPAAMISAFGDSALTLEVRAWTEDVGKWLTVRSDLLATTLAALHAAGIAIAYDQLDVHVRTDAAATA